MTTPFVGQVVNYTFADYNLPSDKVKGGDVRAAIVVGVDPANRYVDLMVILNGTRDMPNLSSKNVDGFVVWVPGVPQTGDARRPEPGTWARPATPKLGVNT